MQVIKEGGRRLLETDPETACVVAEMLGDPRRRGLDAVRDLSVKFDDWSPASFDRTEREIAGAIAQCSDEFVRDTDFCQGNVRRVAEAQLQPLRPLEIESRPGVWLGHRYLLVRTVGSYVPGGRYPMFGSAQMSIIPAKVAGVKTVVACTSPVKGAGYYPARSMP